MSIIIAPSILSADFANLERDIRLVESAGAQGLPKWLHIDVMDGHFVPNITIGAPVVKDIRKITDMVLDVHLMIENPGKYIDDFIAAGADIITFHLEAVSDIAQAKSLIQKIKSNSNSKTAAGVSIKPMTPPEKLDELLCDLDLVLIMTVEPGFGGQEFMEDCAQKIEYIKKHAPEGIYIEVDGGINGETAKICKNLGANVLVAGNYIYKSLNPAERIRILQMH